ASLWLSNDDAFRRAVVSRSSRLTPVTVYSTSELTLRYVTVNLLSGSVYPYSNARRSPPSNGWVQIRTEKLALPTVMGYDEILKHSQPSETRKSFYRVVVYGGLH